MNFWGKIIGAFIGYVIGDWFGAALGVALGHFVDRKSGGGHSPSFTKVDLQDIVQIQSEFFEATFAVMGHMAKIDGRVSEHEVARATLIMDRMGLTPDRRKLAISYFQKGQSQNFSLQSVINQFYLACQLQPSLFSMFIELQLYAAFSEGDLSTIEKQSLQKICYQLDLSRSDYHRMEASVQAEFFSPVSKKQQKNKQRQSKKQAERNENRREKRKSSKLGDAYSILRMPQNASDEEIKKAYRRLTSLNHPDKLAGQGISDDLMKIAENKTREIRAAYDCIREVRNF